MLTDSSSTLHRKEITMSLTKADLVDRLADTENIGRKEAVDLIEAAFDEIREVLVSGEKISIPKFGNFIVLKKNARNGRNPKSGEPLIITPRSVLTFKPSAVLKDLLNPLL